MQGQSIVSIDYVHIFKLNQVNGQPELLINRVKEKERGWTAMVGESEKQHEQLLQMTSFYFFLKMYFKFRCTFVCLSVFHVAGIK